LDPSFFFQTFESYALAGVISGSRMFGFFAIFPFFGWIQMSVLFRTIIGMALAMPVLLSIQPIIMSSISEFDILMLLTVKEFMAGAILGVILGTPFWGIQGAGIAIDFYRGASNSNFVNPLNADETTEAGQLFLLMSLMIYVATGGLRDTIGLIYESYVVWDVLEPLPRIEDLTIELVTMAISIIFKLALILGAPVLIFMVAGDLFFVLLARTAKNLNVFELAAIFKNLLTIIGLPIYITFLAIYTREDWFDTMKGFLEYLQTGPAAL
jgi:type III secretion protein T